jgi:hypothetical protein
VVPKPSVMPWTWPKPMLTAAMPASTPVATGSTAIASERSEPNETSSSATMIALPAIARRSTSALICARDATPNTPAPDSATRRPFAALRRERAADRIEGLLLPVEIGTLRTCRRDDDRARRVARDPDAAFAARRLARAASLRPSAPSRRSDRAADRLDQRAGRRAEQGDRVVDRGA